MRAESKNIFQKAWKYVASLNLQTPSAPSADELTSRTWARAVESYDEVPEIYRGFFDALPAREKDPFPYTIITPTFKGHIRPENEKLVCCPGESICVLEKIENKFATTWYPLADICCVEAGMVLLHSWITIYGVDNHGVPCSSSLKFNSITEYLFKPILECMRPAACAVEGTDLRTEKAHFDSLVRSNYKFMNFAQRSIRPGEKVVQTILQPEIHAQVLKFSRLIFSRSISTAHLSILTDSELIIIRDDESQRLVKGSRYGGIWFYIPLNKIVSVSLTDKAKDLLVLSIHLPDHQQLESLYQISKKDDVETLFAQLKTQADK